MTYAVAAVRCDRDALRVRPTGIGGPARRVTVSIGVTVPEPLFTT